MAQVAGTGEGLGGENNRLLVVYSHTWTYYNLGQTCIVVHTFTLTHAQILNPICTYACSHTYIHALKERYPRVI